MYIMEVVFDEGNLGTASDRLQLDVLDSLGVALLSKLQFNFPDVKVIVQFDTHQRTILY